MGPRTSDEFEQVKFNFTNHKPTDGGIKMIEENRETAIETARIFLENCPASRERSLAITHLETALMYANAAVARNNTEDKESN